MRRMFKIFTKKLFGVRYEGLKKALVIDLIVFWGLHTAGYRVAVSPSIVYLMASTFSAGVVWRALASEDNAADLRNLFMLPFAERTFVFSYVSAMGAYTLLTKTAGLLAVVFAVSAWSGGADGFRLVCAVICAVNAVLVTACAFTARKRRGICMLWGGTVIAAVFWLWDRAVFVPIKIGRASCRERV